MISDMEKEWLFNFIAEGDLPPEKRQNLNYLRITEQKEWKDYKKNLILVFDIILGYKYKPMVEEVTKNVENRTKHYFDYILMNLKNLESVRFIMSQSELPKKK